MNCEQIQPDLLDYGKGLLSGCEARKIRDHLQKCPDCAALLEEEMAFSRKLAALPDEGPANDVWTLVRARTRPRIFRPLTVLLAPLAKVNRNGAAVSVVVRRTIAAAAAVSVAAIAVYSFVAEPRSRPVVNPPADTTSVTVKWSDDPLGEHTDAMVKLIGSM